MATAEVYVKWSTQGDGNRGAGAWGLFGQGAAHGAHGIVALNQHAERIAWGQAWSGHNNIRTHVANTIGHFPGARLQVKFWVDQQICPSCQKWLIIDVIAHLKQLSRANPGLIVELYAEVRSVGATTRVRVQRQTVWPVTVGHTAVYANLPQVYN